ncbi:syntaxin-like protein [Lentinula detonsa]|uniref:Syntaxin-like protein n=1 Tax=Lentinula detonsa TaxID=2804962 RepID=A0AA38PXS6_9AGAR|nr:syntaxin-like protein [Lentinula detonsa]
MRGSTPTLSSAPTPSQALAKLTSISTKTLSLLLERQRSSTMSNSSSSNGLSNTLHLGQIQTNLESLRKGIVELEAAGGSSKAGSQSQLEAVKLLRKQYERMRGMLLADGLNVHVPSLDPPVAPVPKKPNPLLPLTSPSNASLAPLIGTPPPRNGSPSSTLPSPSPPIPDYNGPFTPYTDDPERSPSPPSPNTLLQTQKQLIDTQDIHLSALSDSISRHHTLSLQINSELDTHHGLLEELDTELDRTEGSLGRARRRLDKVGRGIKGTGSTVCIGVLILVLLVLIIAFKT